MAQSYRAEVDVFHAMWVPDTYATDETGEAMRFERLGSEIEDKVNSLAGAAFGKKVKYQSRVIEGHPVKMVLHIFHRCVLAAGDLAGMLDADLHVVYVAAPGAPPERARSPAAVWSRGRVHDVVLEGEAAEMIVTYARKAHVDLVIVAAEHRPFLEFSTLGRTTERVVRFSPCSVLVIPKVSGKPEFAMLEPGTA